MTSPYSTPYPKVPEAVMTGFRSTSFPGSLGQRSTERSTRARSAALGPRGERTACAGTTAEMTGPTAGAAPAPEGDVGAALFEGDGTSDRV